MSDGSIHAYPVDWKDAGSDRLYVVAGNCYPTREAAEAAAPAYFAKLDAQYAIDPNKQHRLGDVMPILEANNAYGLDRLKDFLA